MGAMPYGQSDPLYRPARLPYRRKCTKGAVSMRLFRSVPPDPYGGLPPKLHPWVDRCKQYYLERRLFGGAVSQINVKRILLDLESSIRRAKGEARKDFERFTKHLDNRGISEQVVEDPQAFRNGILATYLVDDLEVELQHRGMTLDTVNTVFEALEAALTLKSSTRVGEGRPIKDETGDVLFLWSKLKEDRLSMRAASRVIAIVLRRNPNKHSNTIYQTIRNAEIK